MDTASTSQLRLEDTICYICFARPMIRPVTLPCKHEICYECYQRSLEIVNLLCPFCRTRISCWARKAFKENKIINWNKWDQIQTNFSQMIDESGTQNEDEFDYEPIERIISPS